MATLNIHLETFDEKSLALVEKMASIGQIAISIAPWQISLIQKYQISRLKKILSGKGYVLGQQGLNHKCKKCESFHMEIRGKELLQAGVDPWHENYCLWFGRIPAEEQEEFMRKGREKLEKTFGVLPELYVPPNHLLDLATLQVASRMGYKWVTDRAKIKIEPHRSDGVIVVPEGEPEINCDQIYIHADRWRGDLEIAISKGIQSFEKIKALKRDDKKIEKNRQTKVTEKIARDLYKGFGMSEESARIAGRLLYQTKFARDKFI